MLTQTIPEFPYHFQHLFVLDKNNTLEVASWPPYHNAIQVLGPIAVSILKWKAIVEFIKQTGLFVFPGGAGTCALCQVNRDISGFVGCAGCPIGKSSGPYCANTPQIDYMNLAPSCHNKHQKMLAKPETQRYLDAAENELDYLIILYHDYHKANAKELTTKESMLWDLVNATTAANAAYLRWANCQDEALSRATEALNYEHRLDNQKAIMQTIVLWEDES